MVTIFLVRGSEDARHANSAVFKSLQFLAFPPLSGYIFCQNTQTLSPSQGTISNKSKEKELERCLNEICKIEYPIRRKITTLFITFPLVVMVLSDDFSCVLLKQLCSTWQIIKKMLKIIKKKLKIVTKFMGGPPPAYLLFPTLESGSCS